MPESQEERLASGPAAAMTDLPQTAKDLRDLADEIYAAARIHPGYPMAADVIRNACDHIRLMAQVQDYRHAALNLARRLPPDAA